MSRSARGFLSVLALTLPALGAEQGAFINADDPAALYLRAGTINTRDPVRLASLIGTRPAGTRFVIQLDGPITPARRAALVAAGITPGDYLPHYAYIVTLDRADARAAAGLNFVRWAGEYQVSWKIDPDLGVRPYATPERQALIAAGSDRMVIVAFAGTDLAAVEKGLFDAGAAITGEEQVGDHMEIFVQAPLAAAPAIAALPGVQYIEPAPEVTTRNVTTRWVVQSNVAGSFPLYNAGIHGEGQILGLLDNGFDPNHCSFSDTDPIGPSHRKILAINGGGVASHGTHTAGIAVGDAGNDTAATRGHAYAAKMVYNNWPSFTETAMYSSLGVHYGQGARLHSNSWGDDGTTSYNGLCRGIDRHQYDNEDSLVLFAVTNGSSLTNPDNSKNILAVGATQHANNQGTHCYGGIGPTIDQRRKPELYAPGCDVVAAASNSGCGTVANSGTSMACPAMTGTGMLVRQYYTDGYYPGGASNPGGGFVPSAALIKATLLNTGQDMTGSNTAGYPGNREGWGRVLADKALFFAGDTRKLLISDVRNNEGLSTGGSVEIPVNVVGSGEQLRVTLVYTEPAATAGAAVATVNDLDLEVVDVSSNTFLGNVFNTTSGASTTGGAKDPRNNVEQVHINNPATGNYIVRVKGANVAQGLQGYAVVITGDIVGGTPPPLYMSLVTPVPSLLAPGTPLNLDVRIQEGSQTLIAGSPAMHYRMTNSGAFTEVPLVSQGADIYRATLPGASCSNTPQFYFSADATGGTTVTLPGNAPTGVLSTTIGTTTNTTVFSTDFAAGVPAGWTTTGLWHSASGCAPSGACGTAPWMYYGQDSTCNFSTGAANSGSLTSAPIALPSVPAGGSVTLTFCSSKVGESGASWDIATVRVNNTVVATLSNDAAWSTQTVDLTAYAGQTVTLAWNFNSVDGTANTFRGWTVDNVSITAVTSGCTESCYANCDGSTSQPILNVLDFNCFLNRFNASDSYANCDGSTSQPILNVLDFNCFLNRFSQSCP